MRERGRHLLRELTGLEYKTGSCVESKFAIDALDLAYDSGRTLDGSGDSPTVATEDAKVETNTRSCHHTCNKPVQVP